MTAVAQAILLAGEGIVVAEGFVVFCGMAVLAFVGEKLLDSLTRKNDSKCCCGLQGPSGKFKQHFILKANRKEAEEAARHYPGANGVEHHTGTDGHVRPHFHPTKDGKKIPGVHFEYSG
jgi:hypothetical protein